MRLTRTTLTLLCAAPWWGCSSTVDISVSISDPCNQEAVSTMDFLRLEPRGSGIDSLGLATIQELDAGSTPAIEIPLVEDFQLVATGHRGSFDEPAAGIGISAVQDLTQATDSVEVNVPFALVNSFYKTTSAQDPAECTGLQVDRFGASATYIPENGRVLIVGGASLVSVTPMDTQIDYTRAVEMYDPATGRFDVVAELRVGGARAFHTATRLQDGRVLIAGGEAVVEGTTASLKSAFIIDPRNPTDVQISQTLILKEARTGHSATVLPDGRVLIAGGRTLVPAAGRPEDHTYWGSFEVFDPQQGVFLFVNDEMGNRLEMEPRYGHTASFVPGADGEAGSVVIAGGMNQDGPVLKLANLALTDGMGGVQGMLTSSTDDIGVGPIFHSAAVADNGAVLLSGGYGRIQDAEPQGELPKDPSGSVEMWMMDNGTLRRTCSASLTTQRGFHTSAVVGRRAVFVAGRGPMGQPLADAEVAVLALGQSCFAQPSETQTMADARARHSMVHLESSGELLVVGGRQQPDAMAFGVTLDSAEVFSPAREP